MGEARQRLLEAVIADVDRNGIGDRSLREIAESVGTSHRMLIHHFGSREGLMVTIVETVDAAERERAIETSPTDGDIDVRAAYREMWNHFAAASQSGRERLFYECYARGLQGEEPFARMLPGAVTDWLDAMAALHRANGLPAARAKARARLELALVRGLLLDLLATGDRRGTAAAVDEYTRLRALE